MAVLVTRGDAAAPDGTARLVPADALLYAHVSTSEGRTQDARLAALAARFSTVRAQLPALGMALTPQAGGLDFARDVRPWLGDEAALALVADGSGAPRPLLVAAVRDRERAAALLDRVGARPAGTHRGTPLLQLPPRALAAFAGDHLVAGPEAAVRAAIDREAGGGAPSLADGRVFRRAAEDREGSASVDLFATSTGLRRLLDGRAGFAGVLGRLVTSPRLEGVSAQVAAEEAGVRVTARVMRADGGPRRPAFTPTLAGRAPDGVAAHLTLPGLAAVADLLSRSGADGMVDAVGDVLPQATGLELEDVLAPLAGEAALTIAAAEDAPVLTLAAPTRDEARMREVMARLQEPVAARLAGGAPFAERRFSGVDAFTLGVTPQLQPTYAVAGGTVVATTDPSGIAQVRPARTSLDQNSTFEQVIPAEDARVEALGFLDPRQLLALGERTGLQGLGSPALRDDLRRIRSAAAAVVEDARHESDTTAELFFEIP